MANPKPNKPSAEFIRLLKKAMHEHPDKPSLREVARRADLSPAYLSYLLNGERDVPSGDAVKALERALNLPDGELFKAAGKPQSAALEFFRKEQAGSIMRKLAEVPDNKLGDLDKLIGRFVKRLPGARK